MTWQELLLKAVLLAPGELALLDEGIHAIRDVFATGQTEEQAFVAARAVIDSAVDALEASER